MEISSNLYCKTQEITIRLCLVGLQRWSAEQRVTTEEGMATHSSFLAWRIPWTEEPGGLQSMGSQRDRYTWATFTFSWSYRLVPITGGSIAISTGQSVYSVTMACWSLWRVNIISWRMTFQAYRVRAPCPLNYLHSLVRQDWGWNGNGR